MCYCLRDALLMKCSQDESYLMAAACMYGYYP